MRVHYQLLIIEFLLYLDDRPQRVATICRENGYENRIGVDGSDVRHRVAMVCMMRRAEREGKKTASRYMTQNEAWHTADKAAGEALAAAFQELTENQWRAMINALADGRAAARALGIAWLSTLEDVPGQVLSPTRA